MKKLILLSVIAFVFSFTFGLYPNIANAEEREFKVTSYLVDMQFIPVSDVEKHAVGLFDRRGVAIFENGETAAYHTRGTWDFIDSNGDFNGYTTLTYNDGSTTMVKYSGNMKKESGKLPKYTGKGEYIKGTGKYEGIKGTVSFTGEHVTPYDKDTKGDVAMNVKASYTLPK